MLPVLKQFHAIRLTVIQATHGKNSSAIKNFLRSVNHFGKEGWHMTCKYLLDKFSQVNGSQSEALSNQRMAKSSAPDFLQGTKDTNLAMGTPLLAPGIF